MKHAETLVTVGFEHWSALHPNEGTTVNKHHKMGFNCNELVRRSEVEALMEVMSRSLLTKDERTLLYAAARGQALEDAANVCDAHTVDDTLIGVGISKSCASMIRALIGGNNG